jgi:hypothetical protein
VQSPQLSIGPPQPSGIIPHVLPCAAHVVAVHVVAHMLFWHVWGGVHVALVQQLPVTHVPLQLIIPAGHAHVPPWHVSPPVHCELVQQLVLEMHVPLQS